MKFAKEASKIIKELKSPVEVDYYTNYIAKQINISTESIKKEVYGKDYNKVYNKQNNKYVTKKVEKVIEKPKAIKKGKELVEETLIKLLLENKKIREITLLKVEESDFLLNESKEILNYIIKNRDLDKITIDKIKSLNISEEYLKDLEIISLDSIDMNDIKSIDEIVKNLKKNNLQEQMNILLQEQKNIELQKQNKVDLKEVDVKVMEIALKIVEIRKMLQSL